MDLDGLKLPSQPAAPASLTSWLYQKRKRPTHEDWRKPSTPPPQSTLPSLPGQEIRSEGFRVAGGVSFKVWEGYWHLKSYSRAVLTSKVWALAIKVLSTWQLSTDEVITRASLVTGIRM